MEFRSSFSAEGPGGEETPWQSERIWGIPHSLARSRREGNCHSKCSALTLDQADLIRSQKKSNGLVKRSSFRDMIRHKFTLLEAVPVAIALSRQCAYCEMTCLCIMSVSVFCSHYSFSCVQTFSKTVDLCFQALPITAMSDQKLETTNLFLVKYI